MRPWRDETGVKIYACRGNFPGFDSYDFQDKEQIKPGCHTARCPDLSDNVCSGTAPECKPPVYFRCRDKSSCIPGALVCDGYINCQDESDEDEEYCSSCPLKRGDGHPRRLKREKFANTFKCRQRHTNRTICVIPCDGRDDLCEGYEDEMRNCDDLAAGWTYFVGGIFIAIIFSLILWICEKILQIFNKSKKVDHNIFHLIHIRRQSDRAKQMSAKSLLYGQKRIEKDFGHLLITSMWKEELNGYRAVQKFCLDSYTVELNYNAGDEDATNAFFFRTLETNDASQQFFDNIDNGWFFRKKKYFKKMNLIDFILHNDYIMFFLKFSVYVLVFLGYYLDIFKDVLLSLRLYSFLGDDLPVIFFSFVVLTIVLGEMANAISVLHFSPWSKKQRIMASCLIPIVPGIIMYLMHRLEAKIQKQVKKGEKGENIMKTWSYLTDLKRLRAEMRANENFLEHLFQLVILLLLIFIKQFKQTTTVSPYLSDNLVPENQLLFVLSALTSFFSLARGQLATLIAKKNGFVPFLGKMVLLCYYTIGTAVRVFGVLLFFTPNLGIFYTLFHIKLGRLNTLSYGSEDLSPVFEIDSNGTVMYVDDKWRDNYQISKIQDLYDHFPTFLLICTLPIMIVIHFAISFLLHKIYFKGIKGQKNTFLKRIQDDLCTLLCPPVHLDWELIYREGRKTGISIKECWIRSMKVFAAYNILLFLEHVIMLVPLVTLKIALDERNSKLEKDFPPLNDELFSTYITNCLIYGGFASFALVPFISYFLAYLYFVKWHAWSRVLRSHI